MSPPALPRVPAAELIGPLCRGVRADPVEAPVTDEASPLAPTEPEAEPDVRDVEAEPETPAEVEALAGPLALAATSAPVEACARAVD
jgi:hypothetical protein